MAQWVEAPVAKPNDLNLTPGTNTEEGENQGLQAVLCVHHGMSSLTHTK